MSVVALLPPYRKKNNQMKERFAESGADAKFNCGASSPIMEIPNKNTH